MTTKKAIRKDELTESVRIKLTKSERDFLHFLGQASHQSHTKVARILFINQLSDAYKHYLEQKAQADAQEKAETVEERLPESKL